MSSTSYRSVSNVSSTSFVFSLRKVTPNLRGHPPVSFGKKNRMRAILKENMANYILLERLIKVDFGKNINCQFLNSAEENCNNDHENDHASFSQLNELIGYQNSADFFEICLSKILRCCETKECRGFLKFIIFHPWRSSMQCTLHILYCSNLTD